MPYRQTLFCPYCGYIFDSATTMEGDFEPTTDDRTFCLCCMGLMIFALDGRAVRVPTAAETAETMADPDAIATLATLRRYHAENPDAAPSLRARQG